ncbi:MAG TPA: YiiX/YebB-like N1pC/P60 family cysteine hydrolase, partial [Chitinophagales bacterium]|nr:YiiX/YebB-like N1pC/P60 family cysteine hydrolase [Chitinophagales bacterium]
MRFQIFILLGLAFAYASGAYYTHTKPTDVTDVPPTYLQANASFTPVQTHALRDGDIVFNTSNSTQSRAIQYATKSSYSHCGIVFFENGKPFVYEAVQPVSKTPLSEWTTNHYVAKRLKNADDV